MSTPETKRSHAEALADAVEFKALFPAECYLRWVFAGSLRRGKAEVGDVEHVVAPRHGEVTAAMGLFMQVQAVNLLWHHLEALISSGVVTKAIYGDTGFRWGKKYRGVMFRGFRHEFFTADERNWGSVVAIRTGPAEFSQRLVIRLREHGWRNHVGYVRPLDDDRIVPVPTEEEYFKYCGLQWTPPELRR